MIKVDPLVFAVILFVAVVGSALIGAWRWGLAVKRDAEKDKAWLLANTVFKQTFMAELRALEVDAQGVLALMKRSGEAGEFMNRNYWAGKLQAFRDVIVKLGGKIYGA
ncbi:MAG: hypothetical protein IMZ50_14860 [Candidatus Atribacteria bacterium]|nr:hypothetical protein [Candidatus Atribacteria bacterium]